MEEEQPQFHWAWFVAAAALAAAVVLFLQTRQLEGEARLLLEEAGGALARCEAGLGGALPPADALAGEPIEACVIEEADIDAPEDRPTVLGIPGEPPMAAHLVEALTSGDSRQRCRSARALGGFQYASSVLALRWASTQRDDPILSTCAEDVLEWMGERAQAEALIAALSQSHYEARRRVIAALASLKHPRAVPVLAQLIKDTDPRIRRMALEALGEMRQEAASTVLLEALSDPDYSVRRVAAMQLGTIGESRAVVPLGKALADTDPQVRRAAAQALGAVGSREATPALAGALGTESDPEVRAAIADALGKLQDAAALKELIGALSDDVILVRTAAVRALAAVGRPAVSSLEAELGNERVDIRVFAAQALALIGEEAATPVAVLEQALSAPDPIVRFLAAQTLAELGERARASAPALETMIKSEKSEENRMMAAMALGAIGEQGVAHSLVPVLTDPDARVRRIGAEAFARLKPDPQLAIPILSEMLQDESAEVRRTVVRVLGEMNAPSDEIEALLQIMAGDEDPEVRAAAELARVRLQGANRR